jgi:hypothetical protein
MCYWISTEVCTFIDFPSTSSESSWLAYFSNYIWYHWLSLSIHFLESPIESANAVKADRLSNIIISLFYFLVHPHTTVNVAQLFVFNIFNSTACLLRQVIENSSHYQDNDTCTISAQLQDILRVHNRWNLPTLSHRFD